MSEDGIGKNSKGVGGSLLSDTRLVLYKYNLVVKNFQIRQMIEKRIMFV